MVFELAKQNEFESSGGLGEAGKRAGGSELPVAQPNHIVDYRFGLLARKVPQQENTYRDARQLFRRSGVELILPSCDPRSLPICLPCQPQHWLPNIFITVPPAAGDEAGQPREQLSSQEQAHHDDMSRVA